MTALARLSLANRSLVIMIAVVLSAFGAFAIPSLKQQLLPSLSFPGAFVVAPYLGPLPRSSRSRSPSRSRTVSRESRGSPR
nr:hypothetical protein GCM10020093_022390 [Planobispora longispora]